MTTTKRWAPVDETFEQVRLLVYRVTHKFASRYNLPFDELLSVSHYAFVKAYHRFKPRRGAQLSSWVYSRVTTNLQDYIETEFKHGNHDELREELCGMEDHDSFRVELLSRLHPDARVVVRLVLDAPDDFATLLRWKRVRTRREVRRALREQLELLGWDDDRIAIAFDDVQQALAS